MRLQPWSYTAKIMHQFERDAEGFPWHEFSEELCSRLPMYVDARDLGSLLDWHARLTEACAVERTQACSTRCMQAACAWISDVLALNACESYYVLADALAYASTKVLGVPHLLYQKKQIDYAAAPLLSTEEYVMLAELVDMRVADINTLLSDLINTHKCASFATAHVLDNQRFLAALHGIFKPAGFTFTMQSSIDQSIFDLPVSHKLEICIA